MAELGRRAVDRLFANDPQGVLDVVYGQRRQNDPNFDSRFLDAIRADPRVQRAPQVVLQLSAMPAGERVLLGAYLNNPGGMSRPEDIAEIAVRGAGHDVNTIRDMYADLRARSPSEAAYRDAVSALDRQYASRYSGSPNGQTLNGRLTDGLIPELGPGDRRRYLSARLQAPDALTLHDAVEGRYVGHDGEAAMTALMQNIYNPQELGNQYRAVVDQSEAGPGGVERLRRIVDGNFSGSEATRARALLDTTHTPQERAVSYLDATLRAYTAGDISGDALLRSFRTLATGEGAPTNAAELAQRAGPALEAARAHAQTAGPRGTVDGPARAMLDTIVGAHTVEGPAVVVAEVRAELEAARGSRDRLLAVAHRFDQMGPEDRAAVQASVTQSGGFTPYLRNGRTWIGDFGLTQRLNEALAGRNNDPQAILAGATQRAPTARPADVLAALDGMTIRQRGAFPEEYDRTHGAGAFERAASRLPDDEQRRLRSAVSVPRDLTPEALSEVVRRARSLTGSERAGLSGWMSDHFGSASPVLGDSTRELVRAADALRAADPNRPINPELVRELVLAHGRFTRALESNAGERREIAENAALISTLVVGAATGGAAFTVASIARAAAAVGITAVGSKAAALGSRYTVEEAMKDFLMSAAGEGVGIGVFRGAQVGVRALRGAPVPR